jgi:hypothetical protein
MTNDEYRLVCEYLKTQVVHALGSFQYTLMEKAFVSMLTDAIIQHIDYVSSRKSSGIAMKEAIEKYHKRIDQEILLSGKKYPTDLEGENDSKN